jgi:hypothetical protein
MENHHFLLLTVLLIVGYVAGRLWATPARWVGLP